MIEIIYTTVPEPCENCYNAGGKDVIKSLNYRPARVSDLEPAMAMIIEAIDALERQHGFEGLICMHGR